MLYGSCLPHEFAIDYSRESCLIFRKQQTCGDV
jgi:hypothetical protein